MNEKYENSIIPTLNITAFQLRGGPEYVIFKGRMVTDQGLFRPMTGYGQFQPCPPFPKELYAKIKERKEAMVGLIVEDRNYYILLR